MKHPLVPIYDASFDLFILKTGTNKPTTFGSFPSSLFGSSFNRELNRKSIVDPLTNSFGVLEIIFLTEMCSFLILISFNGTIVQQFVKVHANGAQRICPVSTQLFLWLARKHFLFHADFLRRVLSIFSIPCFQHQSHLTVWNQVVLFFWCSFCTRLNLGYNPPLKILYLLRSLFGFYHLGLQDEKLLVHESLWSKPLHFFKICTVIHIVLSFLIHLISF